MVSMLSSSAVKATTTSPENFTSNAVWIEDHPTWLGIYVLTPSTMADTVNTLAQNHIKYVFLGICSNDYWNNEGTLDIGFKETNATYTKFVSMCHAQGIDVLVWLENNQDLNFTPANWNNLLRAYNNIMAAGNFDGINSDIEQGFVTQNGTYQNYVDFNNNMTVFMHAEQKLWMPDIVLDWQRIYNSRLHVDAIVSMFYSNVSAFENANAIEFWQSEWNPTPASPIILGIFCSNNNANPDAWQFTQFANYVNSYPPANLVGISLWLYETVTTRGSWIAFENLKNVISTPTPDPLPTQSITIELAVTLLLVVISAFGTYFHLKKRKIKLQFHKV
jgi:hypothetical protein